MPEASFQHITSNISGREPNIGEALPGELIINTSEGRVWVGDENRVPIELGGAVKGYPIGDPNSCNYSEVIVASSEDLPIRVFDPTEATPGFFKKVTYIVYLQTTDVNVTFDQTINWGANFLSYNGVVPTNANASNPIDGFKLLDRKIVIELCTYGPSSELIGRLLWMS